MSGKGSGPLSSLRPSLRRATMPGGRIALAAVMVGGVAVVAFGTGFTTTKVLTPSDTVWMQKGFSATEINEPSRHFEATAGNDKMKLAAKVQDPLKIVQDPSSPSEVYAVDPATHKAFQIPLTSPSLQPEQIGASGDNVLAAGKVRYLVNQTNGTLTPFSRTLVMGTPLPIPGGIASATITSKGVVYVGSDDGRVSVVQGGKVSTTSLGPDGKGHQVQVSIVGNQPIAIDPNSRLLHLLAPTGASTSAIPLSGKPNATVQVAPTLSGTNPLFIEGNDLVTVSSTASAPPIEAPLPVGDTFSAPVENGGKAYVADNTTDQVLVYDAALHLVSRVTVPRGRPGTTDIELIVKDGAVWANNPTSSEATVIQPDGKSQIVDKGTGDGVITPGQAKAATHKSVSALGGGAGAGAASAPKPGPKTGKPKVPSPPATTPTLPSRPKLPVPPASPPPTTAPPHVPIPTTPPPTFPKPTLPPPTTPPATLPPEPTPPPTSPSITIPPPPPEPLPTTPPRTLPNPGTLPNPAGPTPTTPRPTTPPPTTPQGTAPKPTPTTPTTPMVTVPTGLEGQTVTQACQTIESDQLQCNQHPLSGTAPQGVAPNVATAVPQEGKSVAQGTRVEVDYYTQGAPQQVPPIPSPDVSPDTYCAAAVFQSKALICSKQDLGKGDPPDEVKSINPTGTVAYGTTVTVSYYSATDQGTVPAPTPGEDPQTYCNTTAPAAGFTCLPQLGTESDTNGVQGLADPGVPVNQVVAVSPTAGSTEPLGSQITATYFDQAGQSVGTCNGVSVSSNPGCSLTDEGTSALVGCNVMENQSIAPGTVVKPGTEVTAQYNDCATAEVTSEWHPSPADIDYRIHFIELGTAVPQPPPQSPNTSWLDSNTESFGGFAASNGACPLGTQLLYQSTLPITDGAPGTAGYSHITYTFGAPVSGWSGSATNICVYPPSGAACPSNALSGATLFYAHPIIDKDKPNQAPLDNSWTPNPTPDPGQPSTAAAWCEVPVTPVTP